MGSACRQPRPAPHTPYAHAFPLYGGNPAGCGALAGVKREVFLGGVAFLGTTGANAELGVPNAGIAVETAGAAPNMDGAAGLGCVAATPVDAATPNADGGAGLGCDVTAHAGASPNADCAAGLGCVVATPSPNVGVPKNEGAGPLGGGDVGKPNPA